MILRRIKFAFVDILTDVGVSFCVFYKTEEYEFPSSDDVERFDKSPLSGFDKIRGKSVSTDLSGVNYDAALDRAVRLAKLAQTSGAG